MKDNRTGFEKFMVWFGLGALMFGTYCGANMASGAYAANYMVTKGGGHMWLLIGMFVVLMAFFCGAALDFIRVYNTRDYNSFYMSLWGLRDEDGNLKGNAGLRMIVTVFYDFYSTVIGVVTVAATMSLFASLLNSLWGIPTLIGSIISLLLFAVLSMYGAAFLRRFNTAMTIALAVSLVAILALVIGLKGDVLAERLGSLSIGSDWGTRTVKEHYWFVFLYCGICCSWGGPLSNYCDRIKTKSDAWCSGVFIGVMIGLVFLLTSLIVLPYMPDVATENAPILAICTNYLPKIMTAIYWAVVMFSVVSTGPTFIFNTSNRFIKVWKNDNVPQRMKLFIIAMAFLLLCLLLSFVGLIAICQVWYKWLGTLGIYFMGIPIIYSLYRVWKKDQAAKAAK